MFAKSMEEAKNMSRKLVDAKLQKEEVARELEMVQKEQVDGFVWVLGVWYQ